MLTIGHSTHELDAFVALLTRHGIEAIADVRRMPASRRMPHFAAASLRVELPAAGVGYVHLPELGGFRKPAPDSPNAGWDHRSFRGYADHMASDEFAAGLARLLELADARRTAVMCAEAQWHRCHRRLVSDALVVRGRRVLHVGSDGRAREHELTPFAVADGTDLAYPPSQTELRL